MTPDLSFTKEPHLPESSVVRMDTQDNNEKAGEYHHRCDDRSNGVKATMNAGMLHRMNGEPGPKIVGEIQTKSAKYGNPFYHSF